MFTREYGISKANIKVFDNNIFANQSLETKSDEEIYDLLVHLGQLLVKRNLKPKEYIYMRTKAIFLKPRSGGLTVAKPTSHWFQFLRNLRTEFYLYY